VVRRGVVLLGPLNTHLLGLVGSGLTRGGWMLLLCGILLVQLTIPLCFVFVQILYKLLHCWYRVVPGVVAPWHMLLLLLGHAEDVLRLEVLLGRPERKHKVG
jgi:hypothetical protein